MSHPTAPFPIELAPLPTSDVEIAQRRKLVFEVVTKEKRGAKWQPVFEGSITEAYRFAPTQTGFFEVALFENGFFYWSTRNPTTFNTLNEANLDAREAQRRTEQF